MSVSQPEFDVVIIGAGIAGASMACALNNTSLKVLLLEGGKFLTDEPETVEELTAYDARVSAITLGSQAFLESIGAWQDIEALRMQSFTDMYVWDGEGVESIHFTAEEIAENQLGYIIENRIIVHALQKQLQMSTNIKMLDGVRVKDVQQLGNANQALSAISLTDGKEIQARLVVGADGANSFVRQVCDFKTREWDYGHHAIVCTVKTEKNHQRTAWQRFTRFGPIALLPLYSEQQQFCSIVWSAEVAEANRLMALTDEEFCQALSQQFEFKLGKIEACSKRFSFPLRQRHAKDYVQQGVALVGDAAHTIHPLAGQGINLGIQDVRVLSEEILKAAEQGKSISDLQLLLRYQRRRKGENLLMMGAMEGFKRLFEQKSLLVTWVRNKGMAGVEKLGPIKRRIMKHAMGVRG